MTLMQMKYAIAVADTKSINEAARSLFITQPSLSASVKELENEIGVELFKRTNRGITAKDLRKQEAQDKGSTAVSNVKNVTDAVYFGSDTIPVRYNFGASRAIKIGKELSKKNMNATEAMEMFKQLQATTGSGIREDEMPAFILELVNLEFVEPDEKKRIPLVDSLIKIRESYPFCT